DLARILRLPGTVNRKQPEKLSPVAVTFEYTGIRHDYDTIVAQIGDRASSGRSFEGFEGFEARCESHNDLGSSHQSSGQVPASPVIPAAADDLEPSEFPPGRIDQIVTGCAWMRHCRDDAKTLPE